MSGTPLGADALDLLFRSARSYNSWDTTPVTETDLRQLYDLVKMGPTSANTSPARFIFCSSPAARARLSACATANNKPKILAAPVTVIIGFDMDFGEKLPELFPQMDVRSWFADPEVARETAFRNSSLQGAYFIMAARSLGWDTGPMSRPWCKARCTRESASEVAGRFEAVGHQLEEGGVEVDFLIPGAIERPDGRIGHAAGRLRSPGIEPELRPDVLPSLALEPIRVSESVYFIRGEAGVPSPANRGHTSNAGFVLG